MSVFLRVFNRSVVLPSRIFFVVVLSFLFGFLPAFAATIERVSVSSASVEGDVASTTPVISADGRYVVFRSSATNLVSGDTNGAGDIFVYDRLLNTIERVSVNTLGAEGNSASSTPSITDDGRYVVFASSATNLVSGDTNGVDDIFVYDRTGDSIERVNVSDIGAESNSNSQTPAISDDGRYVSFGSGATNLVVGDTNGVYDIFVYDRDSNTIERVSVDGIGGEANDDSAISSISSDGRYVVFSSIATDLVAGDTNISGDVFVYDRDLNTIERVSIDDLGGEGDANSGISSTRAISDDGRYVTFSSSATDLVGGDTNVVVDVFVYDRDLNTIERVSVDDLGNEGNNNSVSPSISHNGQFIIFNSAATDLVASDTNGVDDVFVYDRDLNTIERVSVDSSGTQGNGASTNTSISEDGQYKAFASTSTNIVFGDTNGVSDIFVHDTNNIPTDISLSNSSINENQDSGTVIGAITTTDADLADSHTYSIACTTPGADDASFSISGSSLLSAEEFNYEDQSSYAVCIRTDDGNDGTYDENFTITIVDENESSTTGSGGNGGNNNPPPPPPPPGPIDPPPPPPDEPIDDEELPPPPPPIDEPVEEDPLPEDPDDEPILPVDNDSEAPNDNQDGVGNENELPGRNDFEIRELPGLIAGAVVELVAEVPKEVADTMSVIGVALPTIIFAISQPTVAANVVSIPLRLSNLIPIWLGLRRKKRPWGTVYDSVTKQPLDPVYVTLKDSRGKVVATTITDLDGRFGFLVPPGRYKISAKKDDYVFPSRKLAGKTSDELYNNLYFGSDIEITGTESLVINNIAMDSTSFNWNEFEKAKNKRLMKFYSKRDVFLARIAEVSFWGGLVFSVALLFIGPGTLNYVLFGIYAFVLILRFLGVKPKKPGYVVETGTGFPLSFGLVRIFSAKLGKEVSHAIISKTGRYYALVPKGEYYLSIEKKVGEDEYKEVYKSEPFSVKKGFMGRNFNI